MTTIPELRAIAIEAYATMQKMPSGYGPSEGRGYVLEYPGMYADELTRVRILPSAHEISRMDKLFDAVNKLESEHERKEVNRWMQIQNSKHLTIGHEAQKLGLAEHQYRGKINAIFQKVSVYYNINPGSMLFTPVEHCDEIGDNGSTSDEARTRKQPTFFRDETAKPRAEDETPKRQHYLRTMFAQVYDRMGEAQRRQRAE